MSFELLRTLGIKRVLIGLVSLVLILMLVTGSWSVVVILVALALAAYFGLRYLKSFFTFKAYDGAWRYGSIVGSGLLVAMLAAWALLGWTTILFMLGALAVSLTAYAVVLSLQRMSIPNSVINVTTNVRLKAPRFRNWGRYVLKAELITEIETNKGKTRRLHTKRMQVKVHREDFPEGRLVEACHEFVQNFVEKERQMLLKSYPDTPLSVDTGYFQQIKRIPSQVPIIVPPPAATVVEKSPVVEQSQNTNVINN